MFRIVHKAAISFLIMLFTHQAVLSQSDGPFGFEMGKPIADYPSCRPTKDFVAECTTAPRTHPSFESYSLFYTQDTGICAVTATGKDIDTNGSGTQLKAEADELASELTKKYGSPKSFNILATGSIWKEPQYWMMSIIKNDRNYVFFWLSRDGLKMPNNIMNISLNAYALKSDIGYLSLRYEFKNHDQCSKARKSKASGAL